ncbi:unnamed protein product [Notodromas monacha]|uniref:Uncharacterized protein n=1 Tax=Notodromas monacha TaxID=399045 RepID=A0A7R9BGJ5_9CRUS|nr:unnamed protein product [Notodromas monacha]CAG0913757.1 unnamed protein product [Notodromas monacha]
MGLSTLNSSSLKKRCLKMMKYDRKRREGSSEHQYANKMTSVDHRSKAEASSVTESVDFHEHQCRLRANNTCLRCVETLGIAHNQQKLKSNKSRAGSLAVTMSSRQKVPKTAEEFCVRLLDEIVHSVAVQAGLGFCSPRRMLTGIWEYISTEFNAANGSLPLTVAQLKALWQRHQIIGKSIFVQQNQDEMETSGQLFPRPKKVNKSSNKRLVKSLHRKSSEMQDKIARDPAASAPVTDSSSLSSAGRQQKLISHHTQTRTQLPARLCVYDNKMTRKMCHKAVGCVLDQQQQEAAHRHNNRASPPSHQRDSAFRDSRSSTAAAAAAAAAGPGGDGFNKGASCQVMTETVPVPGKDLLAMPSSSQQQQGFDKKTLSRQALSAAHPVVVDALDDNPELVSERLKMLSAIHQWSAEVMQQQQDQQRRLLQTHHQGKLHHQNDQHQKQHHHHHHQKRRGGVERGISSDYFVESSTLDVVYAAADDEKDAESVLTPPPPVAAGGEADAQLVDVNANVNVDHQHSSIMVNDVGAADDDDDDEDGQIRDDTNKEESTCNKSTFWEIDSTCADLSSANYLGSAGADPTQQHVQYLNSLLRLGRFRAGLGFKSEVFYFWDNKNWRSR